MTGWMWNIDRQNQDYFKTELEQGRLRQGWGYDPALDLRDLQDRIARGDTLTVPQQAAWDRCHPMLTDIRVGDLVAVKNLPDYSHFTLVEVTGDYNFRLDPIGDYAHCIPISIVQTFHKQSDRVPAPLTSALNRAQHPLGRTIAHHDRLLRLAQVANSTEAMRAEPFKERLARVRSKLIGPLQASLKNAIDKRQAERLTLELLRRDGLDVVWTAGPMEQGADVIGTVQIGYGFAYRLAVQVKMHWDIDNDTRGIEQLTQAIRSHQADAGLLVTFADQLGGDLQEHLKRSQREQNIQVLYGDDLYERLLELISDPAHELS